MQRIVFSTSTIGRKSSTSAVSPALSPSTKLGMRIKPSACTIVVITPAPRAKGTATSFSPTRPRVTRINSSRPRCEAIFFGTMARTDGKVGAALRKNFSNAGRRISRAMTIADTG